MKDVFSSPLDAYMPKAQISITSSYTARAQELDINSLFVPKFAIRNSQLSRRYAPLTEFASQTRA